MTAREKMHSGELYLPTDEGLFDEQQRYMELLYEFNHTRPSEAGRRTALLREMFAEFGEGSFIEPPLHANWGGHHVHFGKNVFANFNLTMVDDTHIYVGDNTLIAPNVTITVANHPLDPELRQKNYQYNLPVRIGRGCWIGMGAMILPGVTVGDGAVIGAGSVVTHDIPGNTLAMGTPCRVVREIGEYDREYYRKGKKWIIGSCWRANPQNARPRPQAE